MTIYELSFLVCSTYTGMFSDGSYTTTCKWEPDGRAFAKIDVCEREAAKAVGSIRHSFLVDAGNPTRDKARCLERSVTE